VPPLPTVSGPEAADLLPRTHGFLVTRHRRSSDGLTTEIAAVALPSLNESTIQPPIEAPYSIISQVSGPDQNGRIAYVQENISGGLARLGIIRLDGTANKLVMTSTGRAGSVFGAYPTLAPRGGNIAVMVMERDTVSASPWTPVERLAIWNVDTRRRLPATVDADDIGVSWFPDGNKLVYVASIDRKSLSPESLDDLVGSDPACRATVDSLDLIPMVTTLDVQSGEIQPLHAGTNPVVSSDGRSILLECGHFQLVDATSHAAVPTTWAGDTQLHMVSLGSTQTPLALLDSGVVLYWGLPTAGTPVRRSPYGSFEAERQLVTIKLAMIGTRRFQTVLNAIDPGWQVSFGRPAPGFDTVRDSGVLGRLF